MITLLFVYSSLDTIDIVLIIINSVLNLASFGVIIAQLVPGASILTSSIVFLITTFL